MDVRAACRESFARFGMGLVAVGALAVGDAPAQTAPAADAESALATARKLVDPITRCEPPPPGEILVCGSDTDRNRLSPELRAIAGVGQDASPQIPRAEAQAMSLDKLPYNWMSMGGRYKPGPEYNPLYEMAKRATDPETGTPPPETPPD